MSNPFNKPEYTNTKVEEKLESKTADTSGVIDAQSQETKDNLTKLQEEQRAEDKKSLDQNHGVNIATTGGTYGNVNDRNYKDTLRLVREADRYNNKPLSDLYWIGPRGNIKNLGTGFNKPQLSTVDTRAMDQMVQLDTSQKQLAQQLQHAANSNDIDAFKKSWELKYGIEIDTATAKREMRKLLYNEQVQNLLYKERAEFDKILKLYMDGEAANAIIDVITNGDSPMAGQYLAMIITGQVAPGRDQMLEQKAIADIAKSMTKGRDLKWDDLTDTQKTLFLNEATHAYNIYVNIPEANRTMYDLKKGGNAWARNAAKQTNRVNKEGQKAAVDSQLQEGL